MARLLDFMPQPASGTRMAKGGSLNTHPEVSKIKMCYFYSIHAAFEIGIAAVQRKRCRRRGLFVCLGHRLYAGQSSNCDKGVSDKGNQGLSELPAVLKAYTQQALRSTFCREEGSSSRIISAILGVVESFFPLLQKQEFMCFFSGLQGRGVGSPGTLAAKSAPPPVTSCGCTWCVVGDQAGWERAMDNGPNSAESSTRK